MKLQNRVREFRAKHRLSQGDLGKAIGSSRQTISLIERGDYAPSIVLSLKIAQIFGAPVEEIFMLVEGEEEEDYEDEE
ncbi:transcriptional regulator [Bacillus mycoides]|uniref:Transcriptional regulator n=2 Tax=Bacillus mycoides TaxID=1405 RepID=A0A1S9TBC1_BACMY|nr:transcriptional regulator [Bacillus mycoides]